MLAFSIILIVVFLSAKLFYSFIGSQIPKITDHPRYKGTVGLLLYTIYKNDIYILLGRESADADTSKAFQFSEFGGATLKNQTFMENLLREAKEESCGLINMDQQDILKNGKIFYVKNKKRDIFYVLVKSDYAFNNEDFLKNRKTNTDRKFLEKDQVQWLLLKDLLAYDSYEKEGFTVNNIDGHVLRIKIRPFFWNDCLSNLSIANHLKKETLSVKNLEAKKAS